MDQRNEIRAAIDEALGDSSALRRLPADALESLILAAAAVFADEAVGRISEVKQV